MEEHIYSRFKVNLSLRAQLALIVSVTGVALWLMFFTPIVNAHDYFHASRHSIGILACH
jgi:hypothetical protein